MLVHAIILLASGLLLSVRSDDDPCLNHRSFPATYLGSRNERCPIPTAPVCDYYLPEDWYAIEDGSLLNKCPMQPCGVSSPAWVNGTLPSDGDGIVDLTVCVKFDSDCCKDTVQIQAKKCDNFHVFNLQPLNSCPSGYCIESDIECGQPTPPPVVPVEDPCDKPNTFPARNFGSRNGHCPSQAKPGCDFYLKEGWYSVPDGATMLNRCPSESCGVTYPLWLNGSLPSPSEGIVERHVCVKDGSQCCKSSVTVEIKACNQGHVYKPDTSLPINQCPYAYCYESNQKCTDSTDPPAQTPEDDPSIDPTILLVIILVTTTAVLVVVIGIAAALIIHKGKKLSSVSPLSTATNSSTKPKPSEKDDEPPPYEE